MAYGLEVYDSLGNLRLSVTTRVPKYHSQYTGTVLASSIIYVNVTGLSTDGTWTIISFVDSMGSVIVTLEAGRLKIENPAYYDQTYTVTIYRI